MVLPIAPSNYGPPLMDFSALGDLGNQYYKGAEQKRQYDLARAFQGGVPKKPDGSPDFAAMTETLARHGAVDIPSMQDQAERSALQGSSPYGSPGGGQQAPAGAAVPPAQGQGTQPVTSFRTVPPSSPGGAQNEGALNQGADKGENLRTLATGLANGRDVSDIIARFAQVAKIGPDDPLTAAQEAQIKPILAKSIAARAAMGGGQGGGTPPAGPPVGPPQGAPSALMPPGVDPRQEIAKLRAAGENLLRTAGPHGTRLAQQYFDRADKVESDSYGEVRRSQSNIDRAFEEQKRQHDILANKPMVVTAGSTLANPLTGTPLFQSDTGLLDKPTIDAMARQAMSGDTSVFTNLGRGAQGAENVIAVRKRIAELNSGSGESGAEQAQRNAEFFGVKSGQRTLGTRSANIELAATEFKQVLPVVQEASKAVSRTNYPDLNKIIQMFEEKTGDPNVVKFGGGVNTLVNLYARAISPSGNPTVSDKDHARLILNRAWSQGQFDAAVGMMSQEIEAALSSPDKVRDAMRKRFLEGQGGAKPASGGESGGAAPSGAKSMIPSLSDIQDEMRRRGLLK